MHPYDTASAQFLSKQIIEHLPKDFAPLCCYEKFFCSTATKLAKSTTQPLQVLITMWESLLPKLDGGKVWEQEALQFNKLCAQFCLCDKL